MTGANGQPAVAAYTDASGDGTTEPFALSVLTIADGLIVEIVAFHDPGLFAAFALPAALAPSN
jgi:RNA polymerase sigma-70 factor (ECF subfamily)